MLKIPILKVDLIYFFNASICTKFLILQNGLQIDEILILKKIQINEDLKDIYILSKYACNNQNISKFQCEVGLNTILTSHFQKYF